MISLGHPKIILSKRISEQLTEQELTVILTHELICFYKSVLILFSVSIGSTRWHGRLGMSFQSPVRWIAIRLSSKIFQDFRLSPLASFCLFTCPPRSFCHRLQCCAQCSPKVLIPQQLSAVFIGCLACLPEVY